MSGHSKWHNIQAHKSVQDAKKSKFFTKVTKELMLAAKAGGADTALNTRLKSAIAAAKAVNLPKDKIEQAIKKGTGELVGESLDEVLYEGYGPGGVALLIEAATDNRNRTVAEIRHILAKGGGAMGESGCVGWMFSKKGIFSFPKAQFTEDQLMEIGLENGVEDITDEDDVWEVHCAPEDFDALSRAFEAAGIVSDDAEVSMVPSTTVALDEENGQKLLRLVDNLEDNDDVQKVHTNGDLPDSMLG